MSFHHWNGSMGTKLMRRAGSASARAMAGLILAVALGGALAGCRYQLRQARGAVLPMPARSDVRTPDLLITNWAPASDSEAFYVSYTSKAGRESKTRKVLWEKQLAEADSWYSPLATFDGERIYYVVGPDLLAWSRVGGALAWEVTLSDLVQHACQRCIARVGDSVVALTEDYVLQGVDAKSGEETWRVRLNDSSTAYGGFYVLDQAVALLDNVAPGVYEPAVHIYDAGTGRLVRQIAPTCPDADDEPRFDDDGVWMAAGSTDGRRAHAAYVVYTCNWDPYVECWDLGSGRSVWQEPLPEGADNFTGAVLGQESLYLVTRDGLLGVDLANGQTSDLGSALDPDWEVMPVAEQGNTILARAKRTRGSTRHELWGLDPAGERIWRHEVAADTLYGVDSGIEDWGFRLATGGLLVVQILDDPERIVVEMLDLETGAVLHDSTVRVENDSLGDIVWDNQYGYLTVWGEVYAIDLERGTVAREWP